ncbi:MAG: insulinase family protein [Hyphomonadaceae bacterium]|nr:insulinase family protein [Hyphomonadaceae bacterium]
MRGFLTALALSACALISSCATPPAADEHDAAVERLLADVNIAYDSFTLDNGLRVVVHEDRKAPVVAVSVWYNVGSKDEPPGRTGFAHLFEHLMFNGSENAPGDYFEPLREIGATDLNGTTWFDRTNYFQTVPTSALERTLFLESDRMGHLLGAVTQENLTNQIGVVQNEKRQGDNQPYGLVEYAQLEALFPEGHPYRHSTIGSMADLSAATLADVHGWFRERYGPNNAVLVLAGDINAAEARPLVERYFGAIARGPVNTPAAADVPTLPARVDEVMRDRVAVTRLYRNWVVPGLTDDDVVPLSVGAAVLGGLASSRLDNALVRGEQTAVRVTSSVLPFQRVSMFEVEVDVKPGQDADAVSRRLDEIIADLVANGPTEDEVRRTVMRTLSSRIQGLERVGGFSGKAVALAEGMLYADNPDFQRQRLHDLAAVTPEQVRAAMQRWLSRPVYALRVEPGERAAYAEAPASAPAQTGGNAPAVQSGPPRPSPAIAESPALDFPSVERATLSNGIEVVYARRDAVPVTYVAVEFDAGVAADPANRLGTQALMLNLLQEGTTSLNSVQLAEAQERLGATISSGASLDRTIVGLTALSTTLDPSLTLLADVIRNPAFEPSEVERLRRQQLAGIAAELTRPDAIAQRTLPALLYGADHPYGRPFSGSGDPTVVETLTREELIAFHQAWLRPDNATVFVVSDQPLDRITAALEGALGDWSAPAVARGVKRFDVALPANRPRIVLIDRPQSPQSFIFAGQVLPVNGTDDLLNLTAANEVLGGSFLARINMELRERRGWSYGAFGNVQRFEHRTPYVIQAPVQADRTGDSIAAVRSQVSAFLSTDGVRPAELNRNIPGNIRQLAGQFETSPAVLGALRSNALFNRPDNYWETVADRYRGMTVQALDQTARRIINADNFVWVVVGDARVVRPQLQRLGLPVQVVAAQ